MSDTDTDTVTNTYVGHGMNAVTTDGNFIYKFFLLGYKTFSFQLSDDKAMWLKKA